MHSAILAIRAPKDVLSFLSITSSFRSTKLDTADVADPRKCKEDPRRLKSLRFKDFVLWRLRMLN